MRFFSLIASAALAAVAIAQSPVRITNPQIAPKVGETLVVTYEPATASVTLILKNGDGRNLQTVTTIGTSSSGSIAWAVPSNLPNDSYSLEIKPATGESNYVGPFRVQGATGAPTSSASASSTRSATASSSGSVSSGSVTRSSGSTSASASVSASTNGTVSSATLSTATSSGSRPTGSGASQTTGSAPPTNTNAANALAQSPLALVFGALAAFAYLA